MRRSNKTLSGVASNSHLHVHANQRSNFSLTKLPWDLVCAALLCLSQASCSLSCTFLCNVGWTMVKC